jgi:hypothetical protein
MSYQHDRLCDDLPRGHNRAAIEPANIFIDLVLLSVYERGVETMFF